MTLLRNQLQETTVQTLEKVLQTVVSNTQLHLKWLNTLSYLEHCGSRKIHRTDFGRFLNTTILTHMAEEARHALYYKRLTYRIDAKAPNDYRFENMLCGFSGYRYFQSLDSMVQKTIHQNQKFKDQDRLTKNLICYLYVTTVIEERAMMIFPLYNKVLKESGSTIRIDGIIKEEEKHLNDMESMLPSIDTEWQSRLIEIRNNESSLFQVFVDSLFRTVIINS